MGVANNLPWLHICSRPSAHLRRESTPRAYQHLYSRCKLPNLVVTHTFRTGFQKPGQTVSPSRMSRKNGLVHETVKSSTQQTWLHIKRNTRQCGKQFRTTCIFVTYYSPIINFPHMTVAASLVYSRQKINVMTVFCIYMYDIVYRLHGRC